MVRGRSLKRKSAHFGAPFNILFAEVTAQNGADSRRAGCERGGSVLEVRDRPRDVLRAAKVCRYARVLPVCRLPKEKATAFAIASFGNRQRPTLPSRVQLSTLGAEGLNCCVRDGNRCFPFAIVTGIVECVLRTFTTA